jgi:lipoprotein-releasing system permease protein
MFALALRIARRYFFSKNKKTFISLIANISMLGVGVGTMTLVVVLSVFNGLEDLNRELFRTFDADLKITARQGKSFVWSQAQQQALELVPGVAFATRVIQENALLRYQNRQIVVNLKGVDDSFLQRRRLEASLLKGSLRLHDDQGVNYAVMGIGVQYVLSVSLEDEFTPLEVWYPRNAKNFNLRSENAFNRLNLLPGGVFSIEQQYDDGYAFVPLSFAQALFEYDNRLTALEVQLKSTAATARVQASIRKLLGNRLLVLNQDEQHASLLRAIKIEKLFVFITLTFIIAVASFNIFFSLSMLAIEKKNDVRILFAMGATPALVRQIFLTEGSIVAFTGATVGLVLGWAICWLQSTFGFVKMGTVTSLIDAYPVKMLWPDFFLSALAVVVITLVASYFPARRAAQQR